jgi:predicted NBD/HSP70 family sugar kinase
MASVPLPPAAGSAVPPPTDQASVRRSNLALVLGRLRAAGPASRTELATATGLNKATISSLIAELGARGLVRETGERQAGPVGRPARILELDGGAVGALGLEINVDYVAAYGTDLAGRVLADRRQSADVMGASPPEAVDRVVEVAAAALADLAAAGAAVAGIGVAVPGLVDAGTVLFAPNLGWRDVPVADRLAAALGTDVPMLVDNDANLSALAELRQGGHAEGERDLVYLTGEVGVGAGLVVDGRLLRGADGFGGEVGHLLLDPTSGEPCGCGRTGCWETKVGLAPLVRQAMPDTGYGAGGPVRDPEDRVTELLRRAAAGDPRTLNALTEVGRWLGIGASVLVNIVNPRVIVLGGYFARVAPYLLDTAERELARHSIAAAADPIAADARVRMVPSRLGFTAAARGGAAVAVDAVLADPTRVGTVEVVTMSEREGSQRERGARRAGRSELARTGLSEERA